MKRNILGYLLPCVVGMMAACSQNKGTETSDSRAGLWMAGNGSFVYVAMPGEADADVRVYFLDGKGRIVGYEDEGVFSPESGDVYFFMGYDGISYNLDAGSMVFYTPNEEMTYVKSASSAPRINAAIKNYRKNHPDKGILLQKYHPWIIGVWNSIDGRVKLLVKDNGAAYLNGHQLYLSCDKKYVGINFGGEGPEIDEDGKRIEGFVRNGDIDEDASLIPGRHLTLTGQMYKYMVQLDLEATPDGHVTGFYHDQEDAFPIYGINVGQFLYLSGVLHRLNSHWRFCLEKDFLYGGWRGYAEDDKSHNYPITLH